MIGTELDPFSISDSVGQGITWINSTITLLLQEPAIYFVAFAVVGAAAGVARKFVPMKKR